LRGGGPLAVQPRRAEVRVLMEAQRRLQVLGPLPQAPNLERLPDVERGEQHPATAEHDLVHRRFSSDQVLAMASTYCPFGRMYECSWPSSFSTRFRSASYSLRDTRRFTGPAPDLPSCGH